MNKSVKLNSNVTSDDSSNIDLFTVNLGNYLSVGIGTLGIACNTLIIFTILKAKPLRRKENLLLAGLSFYSLMYSLYNLCIGIYRNYSNLMQ